MKVTRTAALLVTGAVAVATDELCISPGTCTPPAAQFQKVSSVVPRHQWGDAGGYCGSMSIQTLALSYGVWVSQDLVRKSAVPDGCGGHTDDAHGYELSTTNMRDALSNLQLVHDEFDQNTPKPQSSSYLGWMKSHLSRGEPLIWFIMCMGDGHDACDQPWDHIEPVWGIYSNSSLDEDDPTVYASDVLVHGSDYAPDGTDNLGYFRRFDSLVDTTEMEGNCSNAQKGVGKNEMYPCLNDEQNYGYAVLGQMGTSTVRVSMTVDLIDEPDVRDFPRTAAQMNATLTISNLVPRADYVLYRWDLKLVDSAVPAFSPNGTIPTDPAEYSTSAYTSAVTFTAADTTIVRRDSDILSSGATYYRCVEA